MNARRSVNALDRAELIAGLAQRWLAWLRASRAGRFTKGFEPPAAVGRPAPAVRPPQALRR